MTVLTERTPLYLPDLHRFTEDGLTYAIDHESPNWVAVEESGARVLEMILSANGTPVTFGRLVAKYAEENHMEAGKAWLHVHSFLRGLDRANMLASEPFDREEYEGRSKYIRPNGLRELWLQINNNCNLTCSHCLVSSGPGGIAGLPTEGLLRLIDEACELGLERLYVTGGEPFMRRDIFEIIKHATETRDLEMIILTNATLMAGAVEKGLQTLDREKVRFQVSIDGASPETNDPIRGAGTFDKALKGARKLSSMGFEVSLTTVTTEENLHELDQIPAIVKDVGAVSQHLMWSHKRGRAIESGNGFFPENAALLDAVNAAADKAEEMGVTLDNLESIKRRVNGMPGVKYDLGNAGWDSICVYADGNVFPSAALANEPKLICGNVDKQSLAEIMETSPIVQGLRKASLSRKEHVIEDPLRYFTGGGDLEHSWCFTGDFLGVDPYYPITQSLVRRTMTTIGKEKLARKNEKSGFSAPLVLHAMGDGAISCETADGVLAEEPVLTLHSNCVLSFDVDKPRAKVREFYGEAAEVPQAELCCPAKYDVSATDHIPQEVLDRFYGCGSPMASAGIREGETIVDLGSGAGIDVFIAAKYVGATGKAIGIDMTDQMLEVANENKPKVAEALGYDSVEFRRGFLEEVPVDDKSVDLVTSNCVVNLSPDKPRVFEEIWRVLKDHGRILISDIVSERDVPPHLKTNPQLWGECLVGALTEEQFLAELERAGFYGLEVQKKVYWKDVEGYPFYSVTVRGYKFEKTAGCIFKGHHAVYLGPGKAFIDEEGHTFPRNEPYEICTDTVAKLSNDPYKGSFAIIAPGEEKLNYESCSPDGACC